MIKLRTVIILLIVYFFSYISINYDINILYPYYLVKDIILYPVKALTENSDLSISNSFKNSIITSLKEDIEELRKLTKINHVLSDFNYVNATIILRNREYWFNNITIDKGEEDGIKVDMPVVDSNGLVGRIANVRNHTSDVKLITTNDAASKISVVILSDNKKIYGVTNGYDNYFNLLKVIVDKKVDISDNSSVLTTGMGGIFPSGILIGEVFDIMDDDNNAGTIVRVKLKANIEGEKYVSILQRKDNN